MNGYVFSLCVGWTRAAARPGYKGRVKQERDRHIVTGSITLYSQGGFNEGEFLLWLEGLLWGWVALQQLAARVFVFIMRVTKSTWLGTGGGHGLLAYLGIAWLHSRKKVTWESSAATDVPGVFLEGGGED